MLCWDPPLTELTQPSLEEAERGQEAAAMNIESAYGRFNPAQTVSRLLASQVP